MTEKKTVGRPQKEKVQLVSLSVTKKTRQAIKERAAAAGVTMQAYLDALMSKKL